jgi:hypothetical protein
MTGNSPRVLTVIAVATCAAMFAPAAFAYVGPGAGLGVLGAMLAIVAAVLATVLGLILWPVRMIMRRMKRTADAKEPASDPEGRDAAAH